MAYGFVLANVKFREILKFIILDDFVYYTKY